MLLLIITKLNFLDSEPKKDDWKSAESIIIIAQAVLRAIFVKSSLIKIV